MGGARIQARLRRKLNAAPIGKTPQIANAGHLRFCSPAALDMAGWNAYA